MNNYQLTEKVSEIIMKKIAVIILFIIGIQNNYASNNIQMSLMTCSTGEQVYASFGHSALRVQNLETGNDIVYNFGMFNPDIPFFQIKFLQGDAQYELGIQSFNEFMKIYQSENRLVTEQVLNLTEGQKILILNRLKQLYLPENRYYLYKFCSENCTTALRDLIFGTLNGDSVYQKQITKNTFRMQLNEYLKEKPWLRFGINLILGSNVDHPITAYESMFLPEYLREEISTVKVGENENLATKETTLNTVQPSTFNYQKLFSPLIVFSILMIAVCICKSINLTPFIYALIGLLGIFILILWLTTKHLELKDNFNLLWCNPLYLVSAILMLFKKNVIQKYLPYLYLFLIACTFFVWIAGWQHFEISFLPLFGILILCHIREIINYKKSIK